MKRLSSTMFLLLSLLLISRTAIAVELITNGGFETGSFAGWTAITPAEFWRPWAVTASGFGGDDGIYIPVPTATTVQQGTFNGWHGVTAGANQPYLLYQDITVPSGFWVLMTWQDKYQMNYTQFCTTGCGTSTYAVEILTTSNVLL